MKMQRRKVGQKTSEVRFSRKRYIEDERGGGDAKT